MESSNRVKDITESQMGEGDASKTWKEHFETVL